MTPTAVPASRSLLQDMQADWQATLAAAAPEVRAELERDEALCAAFRTGWLACSRRALAEACR